MKYYSPLFFFRALFYFWSYQDFKNYFILDKKLLANTIFDKEAIIVYRYEKNGIGPYRQRRFFPLEKEIIHNEDIPNRPVPRQDFYNEFLFIQGIGLMSDYHFSFYNILQLNAWFSEEEITIIEDNGYKLIAYRTTDYVISSKQVMFNKCLAKNLS